MIDNPDAAVPPHRTYIGPAENYELLSARHFMLFFLLGMRERHTFLDFGCGSLRSGRLIMTYLAPDRYCGIDPNRWLIDAAIQQEIGQSLVEIKRPRFAFNSDGTMTSFGISFDFILAHSVLTHAPPQLSQTFFQQAAKVLTSSGIVLATFLRGDVDYSDSEWVYPGLVSYRLETMQQWAADAGLQLVAIPWPHRKQTYFVAAHQGVNLDLVFDEAWRDYAIKLHPQKNASPQR
jgi:SAM-dependent methyltransferase